MYVMNWEWQLMMNISKVSDFIMWLIFHKAG